MRRGILYACASLLPALLLIPAQFFSAALGQETGGKKPGAKGSSATSGKKGDSSGKKADGKKKDGPKQPKTAPAGKRTVLFRLPEMNIRKPLILPAALKKLTHSKARLDQHKALRAAERSPRSDKLIDDWATASVFAMTRPERLKIVHKLRNTLLIELSQAGIKESRAARRKVFRQFVCKVVAEKCEKLLDNHYHVRLNAVYVLGHLDIDRGEPVRKILPTAFTPPIETLLKVVTDRNQHEGIKIAAMTGIRRISLIGEPTSPMRLKLANSLVDEFNREGLHPWYQCRLAEALGSIDLETGFGGVPIIVDALSRAMVSKTRDWTVRSEAAKSLGRCPISSNVDVGLVAYEMGRLVRSMADRYNASPGKFHWPNCFFNSYLAFKPKGEMEVLLYQRNRRRVGLITSQPTNATVKAVYDRICPIVSHVLKQFQLGKRPAGKPIPASDIAELDTWLKSNVPSNKAVSPGLKPLRPQMKAALADPKTKN